MAKKKAAPRDYKKEYDTYHAKPEQKKNRAARNKAHREADPPAGMEVNHKVPLSKGGSNAKSNQEVVTREANRKQYNKTKASPKKKGTK